MKTIKIVRWDGGADGFPHGDLTAREKELIEEHEGNVFLAEQQGDYYFVPMYPDSYRVHVKDVEEVGDQEVGWREDGEANFITFSNMKGWVGRMQFNGEMSTVEQNEMARKVAAALSQHLKEKV